jgi:hypothetical protein
MSVNRLSPQVRMFGVGMVIVLTMLASYVVVGREHIAALDAFAYADPTVSFTASRSAAPSGSVIHLTGAPTGTAVAEFSGDGVLAYSPAFVDASGVATVVPPVFRGGALASGDLGLRLLVQRGSFWSSSAKTAFKVEAPAATGASLGTATLFGLEVTRGLLLHAAETAGAAAAAGAPPLAEEQSKAFAELRLETEALTAQFEAVASGKSQSVTRSGLTIDAAGIRLMDQLMTPYFTSLGPASPSPCGDSKDAQAQSGLTARTVAALKAAATHFVRSLVDCDSQQVREIASRTSAWVSTLGYTAAEVLRTYPEFPKLAGLLLVTVASWGDEATNATYLWKQYGRGVELRSYMLERNAKLVLGSGDDLYITYELQLSESGGGSVRKTVRLPEYLAEAAKQDTYLSGQIERLRKQRDFEHELLESVFDQDEATQALVAQSLQSRQSTPTTPPPSATPTPSPTPTPTAPPTPTPAPATPAPTAASTLTVVSLPPTPSALSYGAVAPPPLTAGKAVTFGFCVPRPVSATALCGSGSANPKGGNPPYTFTYSIPRPAGLTFNSNGLVTGTPTSSGPYSVDVCAKDLSGASVCRKVSGTVAAAPTPQPAACAGTAYAGTSWSGPVSASTYTMTVTFTFGQPTYFASGCIVPIASVRTSDGSRAWGLNTTYPYNYGMFNRLDCGPTACTGFTFTLEQTSGPPICATCTPPAAPAKLIINVYSATVSATAITGNAGTGSSAGGCCGAGTYSLSKQ